MPISGKGTSVNHSLTILIFSFYLKGMAKAIKLDFRSIIVLVPLSFEKSKKGNSPYGVGKTD